MICSQLKNPDLSPQGLEPFYVNATAGTTVYGAFDPFTDIANICEKRGLWMHVDVLTRSISFSIRSEEQNNERVTR